MKKQDVFYRYKKRVTNNSEYIIQRGDTIYKIAAQHGVSVEDIISENNLSSNLIYPGQTIIIPQAVPAGGVYFEEYIIEFDDSLEKIANKLNVRLDLLTKYNDISRLKLAENQVIRIPRQYETYIIQPGDTLEDILEEHNMTLEELLRANMDVWLAVGSTITVR